MLFSARPRPSILLFTSWPLSTPVRPSLVNCAPWSVLKSTGLPCRFMETVDAESGVQCVANPKTRHLATVPINYRHQIAETLFQPDVRDIAPLHLIGSHHFLPRSRCRSDSKAPIHAYRRRFACSVRSNSMSVSRPAHILPRYRQRGTTLHRQQPLTLYSTRTFFQPVQFHFQLTYLTEQLFLVSTRVLPSGRPNEKYRYSMMLRIIPRNRSRMRKRLRYELRLSFLFTDS
nr:MAG: hypothetical protein BECKH772B_GA0070898_104811 [Candidatus Kentron sp. H]VFK08814.1 MAG: hypothetical protein BECKH772C_GA0070978_105501 [Candidatus Kentron sp. H]